MTGSAASYPGRGKGFVCLFDVETQSLVCFHARERGEIGGASSSRPQIRARHLLSRHAAAYEDVIKFASFYVAQVGKFEIHFRPRFRTQTGDHIRQARQPTVRYDPAILSKPDAWFPNGAVQENSLRFYQVVNNKWQLLDGSKVDVGNKTVTASITSLGKFGVLGSAAP